MPCRKTYQINNREEGKAAQRDQSYRSCLITLLIFFFMCLILILACTPWNWRGYRDQNTQHKPQHDPQERTEEATITTVPSTTQGTTERMILSTPRKIPKTVITSSTEKISTEDIFTTENGPTEDTNVVTKEYSTKNIKGSRHFERYFENKTSVDEAMLPDPVSQGDIEDYTTKEILENVKTTQESIGLATLPHDIITDNDNDAATKPSSGPIVSTTTKYATIVDIIKDVMTSKSARKSISDSTNRYYSNKLEVVITTNNVTTPTLLTLSNDLKENASENSTKRYERSTISVDNIAFSPSPSLTDLDEGISVKYSSNKNNYSQFEVTNSIIISTQSDPEEDRNTENSTTKHLYESAVNATLINENYSSRINYTSLMNKKSSTKVTRESKNVVNGIITNRSSYATEKYNVTVNGEMEKYSMFTMSDYINTTTTSVSYNHTINTAVPVSYNDLTTTRTTLSNEDTSVCETGHCKQSASRLLSYMNHSADPCDDFYEYACGGFEANPQLVDGDLVRRARNYQRIASQMLKENRENVHSTFAMYYNSCIQYETNMNFSERIRMASDALREIGEFYTRDTWSDGGYAGFTNLSAKLMLHHSAFLFDVTPELDDYRPNRFTLKIGPATYESPFKAEFVEDLCSENVFETKEQYVDLEILYNNYRRCKNNTSKFMNSIRKALIDLNVFKGLNDSYLEWNIQSEYIEETIHVINSIVMQGYFSNFPPKNEIQEAYLMNNYSKVSLEKLQSSSELVNWEQLIHFLTGMNVFTSEDIQVYFHAALTKGLQELEEFAKKKPMDLNNALMALYAHKLYHELVLPNRDNMKDHCLHVVTNLLTLEASNLYISSFTDHEIVRMNGMIEKTFNELKQTLSNKMQKAQWTKEEGREELLKKIDSLKLVLPVASYFKNRDSLYTEYNESEITEHNYFRNSIILLKRYRVLMYNELTRPVDDPKQIWTYYATPFQSKARVIYALNLVVIPYGIIDWSLINDEPSFNYLLLATLGNVIAHQIAHHFDTNGIHYWNQTRNTQNSFMFENEFTDNNFDDYINCQKENLYKGPMNMTLSFTDQIVSFGIPQLTLNERLSEIMGLRLAYDTLALKSDAKRLPWIQLRIDQLFYLAYAQTYCTKMPLTSSYISLYESEDLPSRIRVFISASNSKHLAEAWNCPLGSQIAPNEVCSVFPYIDTKETAMI